MKFYRYDIVQYASGSIDINGDYRASNIPNPKVELSTFNLYKETPKGYWIGYGNAIEGKIRHQAKWVSKTSRKRYAYPTKKEALKSFIIRQEYGIKYLKYQLESRTIALYSAKSKLANEEY